MGFSRYEDFFGGKKKRGLNKKDGDKKREDSDKDYLSDGSEDQKMDDEDIDTQVYSLIWLIQEISYLRIIYK